MGTISYADYLKARYGGQDDAAYCPRQAKEAVSSIRYARHRAEADPPLALKWGEHGRGSSLYAASFEVDGWKVRFRVGHDRSPDLTFYGTFSDRWQPGAIPNREAHNCGHYYKYFIPNDDRGDMRAYYNKRGVNRHDAAMGARACELRDMKAARGDTSEVYEMEVRAYRKGVELGSASLCGIEVEGIDDPYIGEVARELMGDALEEAREKLRELRADS